jgi:hypothetical protein
MSPRKKPRKERVCLDLQGAQAIYRIKFVNGTMAKCDYVINGDYVMKNGLFSHCSSSHAKTCNRPQGLQNYSRQYNFSILRPIIVGQGGPGF